MALTVLNNLNISYRAQSRSPCTVLVHTPFTGTTFLGCFWKDATAEFLKCHTFNAMSRKITERAEKNIRERKVTTPVQPDTTGASLIRSLKFTKTSCAVVFDAVIRWVVSGDVFHVSIDDIRFCYSINDVNTKQQVEK